MFLRSSMSRYLFTWILLLKKNSKHSSSVMMCPSVSGRASSRRRSLTNLWSSVTSSLPWWKMSIFRVSNGNARVEVINVKASEASCWHNPAASLHPHSASWSCICFVYVKLVRSHSSWTFEEKPTMSVVISFPALKVFTHSLNSVASFFRGGSSKFL